MVAKKILKCRLLQTNNKNSVAFKPDFLFNSIFFVLKFLIIFA